MAQEPFIDPEQRPDVTVDLDSRVGDLTVRQLSDILGGSSPSAKQKELTSAIEKLSQKELLKEPKDHKDFKDHKDPKEHKDNKDNKDHKDPKDNKDNKDTKDHKDPKDSKDQKDVKDPKEPKDNKDTKDHKEPKDHKDHKDIKDRKEGLAEKIPPDKHPADKLPEVNQGGAGGDGTPGAVSALDDVIQRVSRLEQELAAREPRNSAEQKRNDR
jgi:hypothetical protein